MLLYQTFCKEYNIINKVFTAQHQTNLGILNIKYAFSAYSYLYMVWIHVLDIHFCLKFII